MRRYHRHQLSQTTLVCKPIAQYVPSYYKPPMELFTFENYRDILRQQLAQRCAKNARYSQRAFARDLKIIPNRLSEILNGKQGISRKIATQFATSLGFTKQEQDFFCDLVDREHSRSKVLKVAADLRLKSKKTQHPTFNLSHDRFEVVSEWYHLAIVELSKVKGFQSNAKWIAKCLNVSEAEIKIALERLERLGLIKWIDNKIKPVDDAYFVSPDTSSNAVKSFHRGVIEQGLIALSEQGMDEREFNTTMVAIPKNAIHLAKEKIRTFWFECLKELEQLPNEPEDVYCLAIQFFHPTNRGVLENLESKVALKSKK
jgi:uncharacterized protein (TIGR02147 family)